MTDLPQALARLRGSALRTLARQARLEPAPAWQAFALRRRRLADALRLLRKITAAGRLRRLWIRLIGR